MRCDADPTCEETPAYEFRWEWGAAGVCCATHRVLLEQRARDQLNRSISFVPLNVPTPRELAVELVDLPEILNLRARVRELAAENDRLSVKNRQLELEVNDLRERPKQEEPTEAQRAGV